MVMSNFHWIGGRLWIDAVNSEFIQGGARFDGWSDVAALETWLRGASERHEEAGALSDFAGGDEELLARIRNLRAALRDACGATRPNAATAATSDAAEAVEAINLALRFRGATSQLEASGNGWSEREVSSGEASDALWVLARSAARSFRGGELPRLRPCSNPSCILWFLDTSKNGTRRWCSMQGCGNRHKVAAFSKRQSSKS